MAGRYVCIGQRECGKSHYAWTLICDLITQGARRALVWVVQPEAHYAGVEMRRLDDCAQHLDAPVWVFRPPVTFQEVCRFTLDLRRRQPSEELVLVIDELADPQVTSGGDQPDWRCDEIRELLQTVRGVSLVGTTQTPQNMPQPLRQLADRYFLFSVTSDAALRRLKNDGVPAEKLAKLPNLQPYICLESKPGKW